jgi:hypothetical protein
MQPIDVAGIAFRDSHFTQIFSWTQVAQSELHDLQLFTDTKGPIGKNFKLHLHPSFISGEAFKETQFLHFIASIHELHSKWQGLQESKRIRGRTA